MIIRIAPPTMMDTRTPKKEERKRRRKKRLLLSLSLWNTTLAHTFSYYYTSVVLYNLLQIREVSSLGVGRNFLVVLVHYIFCYYNSYHWMINISLIYVTTTTRCDDDNLFALNVAIPSELVASAIVSGMPQSKVARV